MAKYSTGNAGDSGGGGACELCGEEDTDLVSATVAGAELEVCSSCAPHNDSDDARDADSDEARDERDRNKRAAKNAARLSDAATGDSSHWEEGGVDYEGDRLPYLVRDYGKEVQRARQEAGLQRGELADDIDADENDILAVEQGRATQANVGGSVIRALEQRLDIQLAES